VFVTRRVSTTARGTFGPYTGRRRNTRGAECGRAMFKYARLLYRMFVFGICPGYARPADGAAPCLDYFIKRCKAPCVGWQTRVTMGR